LKEGGRELIENNFQYYEHIRSKKIILNKVGSREKKKS
jgi:hypothetical protein